MPSGRCSASREAEKLVPSRSVQALRSPPTSSIASLISRALRPPAPLNTICSKRWAMPLTRAASCREPASACRPTATVSTPGIVRVATLRPLARVVRRIMGSADLGAQGSGGNSGALRGGAARGRRSAPRCRRRRTIAARRRNDCSGCPRRSAARSGASGGVAVALVRMIGCPSSTGAEPVPATMPSSERRRLLSAARVQPALTRRRPASPSAPGRQGTR